MYTYIYIHVSACVGVWASACVSVCVRLYVLLFAFGTVYLVAMLIEAELLSQSPSP